MSKRTASIPLGYYYYYFLICFSILITGITCDVMFPYNNNLCVNQLVEYQCTVTGSSSGLLFLTWKILREDGTLLGSATYISGSSQSERIIGGVFTIEQLSRSPLISNISFTVQSSINGYTIICEDSGAAVMERSIIQVRDNPGDVIIHTDTFTNSSVNISWTESPPYCNTTYRYNISSSALEENIIMESTSNSVMVEGLVLSDDQYCVVVTAIDKYSRRISHSSCFVFNVPTMVDILLVTYQSINNTVIVNWNGTKMNRFSSIDVVVPPVTGYRVSITCITDGYTISSQSGLLAPDPASYVFSDLPANVINCTISVVAINDIGDSSPSIKTIAVPIIHDTVKNECSQLLPQPTPLLVPDCTKSIVVVTSLMPRCSGCKQLSSLAVVTTTPSTSPPLQQSHIQNNNNIIDSVHTMTTIAGISVAITVPVTAVITAIITVIILYLCNRKHHQGKSSTGHETEPINDYSRPPSVSMFVNPLATDEIHDFDKGKTSTGFNQACVDVTTPNGGQTNNELELKTNVAYEQLPKHLNNKRPRQYEIPISSLPLSHDDEDDVIDNGSTDINHQVYYDDVVVYCNTDNDQQTTTVIYDIIPGCSNP